MGNNSESLVEEVFFNAWDIACSKAGKKAREENCDDVIIMNFIKLYLLKALREEFDISVKIKGSRTLSGR